MENHSKLRTVVSFVLIIVFVIGFSLIFTHIWGGKSEQPQERKELIISMDMTIEHFGRVNVLPDKVLKELFDLKVKFDLGKKLSEYGTPDQISAMVTRKLALISEHDSKNWIKIPVKFSLWFIFLSTVFIIAKKRKMSPGFRNRLFFAAILIFGVILGSDPSPMGTVKDAIYLYGSAHAIFPPRVIALSIFLVIVFLANKYICAWGCQIGTLQDLIFRINRNDKQKAMIGKQIKLPFLLSNTVRSAFLVLFTLAAFLRGIDLIDPIDPFKIYKPAYLELTGVISIGILLSASLFIYRPWCHLFCPFGFAGWIVEKISIFKIIVNYDTCIACGKCAAACPSTVMDAILKRDKKIIPDCFACYTCTEVCPAGSITFSSGKRTLPPPGHFTKRKKDDGK